LGVSSGDESTNLRSITHVHAPSIGEEVTNSPDGSHSVFDVQFFEDMLQMLVHGSDADITQGRNVSVGHTVFHPSEYFDLAVGQIHQTRFVGRTHEVIGRRISCAHHQKVASFWVPNQPPHQARAVSDEPGDMLGLRQIVVNSTEQARLNPGVEIRRQGIRIKGPEALLNDLSRGSHNTLFSLDGGSVYMKDSSRATSMWPMPGRTRLRG